MSSSSPSLHRVVSESEQDRLENDNNKDHDDVHMTTMMMDESGAAHCMINNEQVSNQASTSSAMMSHPNNAPSWTNQSSSDPELSPVLIENPSGGRDDSSDIAVGVSSSAADLHLTEGSVGVPTVSLFLPSHKRDHDVSNSSLSGDDEEEDQQGLLRYVRKDHNPNISNQEQHEHNIHHHDLHAQEDQDGDEMSSAEESTMERTGSQNSSRDWGWFEDVHQSLNEATAGGLGLLQRHQGGQQQSQQQQQRPKKRRGLVPQVSSGGEIEDFAVKNQDTSDASAMAVTAPTYVLEESLSSQLLWKETAGQRPPQPADERAFYEKMWAQNFARSNVEYGMPVEVLTATSPISLSPYFDAHYTSSENDHHHEVDYATAGAAAGGAHVGSGNAATAVAEAALQSRMHQRDGDHHQHHHYDPHRHEDRSRVHPNTASILTNQTLVNRKVHHVDGSDLIVLVKGDNVFGTTVSKSFARGPPGLSTSGVDTVNISIASYRVVEAKYPRHHRGGGENNSAKPASCGNKYAQFLVIYREGSIRDTIGVWKRYSDFEELARKVTQSHEGCQFVIANMSPLAVTEEPETELLPNAITSWRLLKKRQRWYRCLDAGYLSLKVFLLERFLHDILFESSSPKLLRDFVGAGNV